MDALALEGAHRLEPDGLAILLHLLGGVLGDRAELLAAGRPVAADVEEQAAGGARLPEDREAAQLLQRLKGGAALADEAACGAVAASTTSTTGRPLTTSSSMSPS